MVDETTGAPRAEFRDKQKVVDTTPSIGEARASGYVETTFSHVSKGDEVFIQVNKPVDYRGTSLNRFVGTVYIKHTGNKEDPETYLTLELTAGPGKGFTHEIMLADIETILRKPKAKN